MLRPGMQNGNGESALHRLLASLDQVRHKVEGSDDDYDFLRRVLESRGFQALIQVHNRISDNGKEPLQALDTSLAYLADEVIEDLNMKSPMAEARELCTILTSPHFKALMHSHDRVAQKDYFPRLPEVPHEVDEDEETVKIVQLVKSNEPLGATIKYDDSSGTVIIARVMHGGAADRSGLIHVGDEVHEVNGVNVRGKTPTDVLHILEESVDGTITFKLIPADERPQARESKVRVRAHFDFEPRDDRQIPCRGAGLPFCKGDILHIVNQDDPNWWQARREGDRNMRAGLIPGRLLQERRILAERNALDDEEEEDFDREELPTYEEVAKLFPRPGMHRPIILIGPPGVGRNELKRRLLASDPDHFKTTIPHTSRIRKHSEIDGGEYYFVSREAMEEDIHNGRYVEHGEYKGNLYGTSMETVKSIVNAGYVCIMNPRPQALKMLRTAELKSYVVYVKPPPFEQLKETRHSAHARSTFDESSSRGFTDDEFHDMISSSNRIEFLYGHLFDTIIVNEDLVLAYDELCSIAQRIETEPQWVPAGWVQ